MYIYIYICIFIYTYVYTFMIYNICYVRSIRADADARMHIIF